MPATHFRCPDGNEIKIEKCLEGQGCRLQKRCATLPYLRLVGWDRKWRGVTPSAAGNGPRLIYLQAMQSYTIDPDKRAWAAFGTSTHDKLGMHIYTHNVLSEEKLSDEQMNGISDVLEEDEYNTGMYVLTDYKTFGSFKTAKALGIVSERVEETILNEKGEPILLKTGKNKGYPKTRQKTIIKHDPTKIDLRAEELQINRYRIFFESYGFPISRMQIQVLTRDGGLYIAKNRGIKRNISLIPIKRLHNKKVLSYYDELSKEVTKAFKTGYTRLCNRWESWENKRCEGFCDVVKHCKAMSKQFNEKWGLI